MDTKTCAKVIGETTLPATFAGRVPLRVSATADQSVGVDLSIERLIDGYGWQPLGRVRVLRDGRVSLADLEWRGPEVRNALESAGMVVQ